MKRAYVDSSVVVSMAFDEPSAADQRARMADFEALLSSNLLEAEVRATFQREQIELEVGVLDSIAWVLPDRSLGREIAHAQSVGHVRGAGLWHLACALYLAPSPRDLAFVTLDTRQADVARRLGFLT